MTSETVSLGWWGLFPLFVTTITLLVGTSAYAAINSLPPRLPGMPGAPPLAE
ncbi:hypothetical protein AB0B25_00220 [Nocardia sp. NPDC049190]|uniref:hypothetical protein n=1 Tax=Nocardia sp. NPDC049190 TaxID=3155650 RepID=UPI0033F6895C